jgi:hypothetical protein
MLLFSFVLSCLVLVVSQTVMSRFLANRVVKMHFGLGATPGYTDKLFLKWCADNNRSFTWVVVVRALSIIVLIVSAIYTNWND